MLSTLTLFIDTERRGYKMDNNIMKKASESCVEQVYQIRPEHLNGAGRLFGGRLMEWIDEVAGQAEWEAGQKRKQLRIQRKVEGF